MALGSFVKLFMPKDKVFYSLFEQVTENLMKMGETLATAMQEKDFSRRSLMLKTLDDLEHKNDDFTHDVFVELGRNFITPFDREDIHYLATALDDVADYIWGSAKRVLNYNVEEVDDVMLNFVRIIGNSIEYLNTAVKGLRSMKDLTTITDCCVKINSLENEADDLLDKATIDLFKHSTNAIELIKKKDLYEELELVTDKCEDAANVIESIIIKYS